MSRCPHEDTVATSGYCPPNESRTPIEYHHVAIDGLARMRTIPYRCDAMGNDLREDTSVPDSTARKSSTQLCLVDDSATSSRCAASTTTRDNVARPDISSVLYLFQHAVTCNVSRRRSPLENTRSQVVRIRPRVKLRSGVLIVHENGSLELHTSAVTMMGHNSAAGDRETYPSATVSPNNARIRRLQSVATAWQDSSSDLRW